MIICLQYYRAFMASTTGIPCPTPFRQVPGDPLVRWEYWLKTFKKIITRN